MSEKKQTIHRIETCTFRRDEHSINEIGLILNEGDLGIIDVHGEKPKEVWTWERLTVFALDLDLKEVHI